MNSQMEIGFAHDRTTGKEDWLTPPYILKSLGEFDLDPCSPVDRPWDTAKHHFTIIENGLKQEWKGRIWLNPPYGKETELWIRKLVEHGNGIALIFARTETKTFFPWVWDYAKAILFLKGRISFYTKEGRQGNTAGAPSCLIAYGEDNADCLRTSVLIGKFIKL